jgi:hypothetical protein
VTTDPSTATRPIVTDPPLPPAPRALVVAAWVIPVVILAQAVLAGQAWFVDPSLFALHGGLGHGLLLLSALVATFTWLVGTSKVVALLSTLVALGLVGQTGLGFAGHRGGLAIASSLHVPLGVALLGASVAVGVLLSVRARPPA